MTEIFKDILGKEPHIIEHLNFSKKDYKKFEDEYLKILKKLDDYNPALVKNFWKNLNFKKDMDGLIAEWGIAPILIYNEHYFIKNKEVDNFEKRKKCYDNIENFIDEYKNFVQTTKIAKFKEYEVNIAPTDVSIISSNKANLTGKAKIYYDNWLESNREQIEQSLNEEQRKTLFATHVFIGPQTEFKVSNNFLEVIINPDNGSKLTGSCRTLAALYITCLTSLKTIDENALFPINSIKIIYYENANNIRNNVIINDLSRSNHENFSINNLVVEPNYHCTIKPSPDYPGKEYSQGTGDIKLLIGGFLGGSFAELSSVENFAARLMAAKYTYIMLERADIEKTTLLNLAKSNLEGGYFMIIKKYVLNKDMETAEKLSEQFSDHEIQETLEKGYYNKVKDLYNSTLNIQSSALKAQAEATAYEAYKMMYESRFPKVREIINSIPEEMVKKFKKLYEKELKEKPKKEAELEKSIPEIQKKDSTIRRY